MNKEEFLRILVSSSAMVDGQVIEERDISEISGRECSESFKSINNHINRCNDLSHGQCLVLNEDQVIHLIPVSPAGSYRGAERIVGLNCSMIFTQGESENRSYFLVKDITLPYARLIS